MRVALITPYLPSPANTGGRIRMYRLARALCEHNEVVLYACAGVREAAAQRDRDELRLYRDVRVRNSDLGSVWPWISSRRVRRSCPARLSRDLARDHASAPFDVLVVEHSYAAATAQSTPGVPLVVDEHNVESVYQREYFAAQSRGAGVLDRREVALLAAWERRVWTRAALVTCVSASDVMAIRAVRSGPVRCVPNGAAIRDVPFVLPSARKADEVLFVGLMSHAPNVAAALFLAREVMPRVWKEIPDARLVLCGRSPEKTVLALASGRIEVTGTVDSVTPFLSRASVYANALFQGAGSSLKVPEALASGVPLVSTALGVRGFPLRESEHFAAASDASGFASEIVRTLRDRESLDERARRGRAVAERFDWDNVAREFATLVGSVAKGASIPEGAS